MRIVRVGVDAMGGDRAPHAIVEGSRAAASEYVHPYLFGPSDVLDPIADGLTTRHAPTVVGMEEKPTDAAREKRESSLFVACRSVGTGETDVVISAGNTGAMLAAALLEIGRLPGVARPGIAVPIPGRKGPWILIDAGANADARPEHLVQFAHMGSIFAEEIVGLAKPSVGLLSIGEEPEKGNRLVREAHGLLSAEDGVEFVGNVESRLLLEGPADVIVADGFVGNMVLKMIEGTVRSTLEIVREEIAASTRGKVGGLLIRSAAQRVKQRFDPDIYGGAYLLGLNGLVVIAHGNSSPQAVTNAIDLGVRGVQANVVERLSERFPARVPASAS
jgi:glycerol-3-phosphate acyltransferase PlsX